MSLLFSEDQRMEIYKDKKSKTSLKETINLSEKSENNYIYHYIIEKRYKR